MAALYSLARWACDVQLLDVRRLAPQVWWGELQREEVAPSMSFCCGWVLLAWCRDLYEAESMGEMFPSDWQSGLYTDTHYDFSLSTLHWVAREMFFLFVLSFFFFTVKVMSMACCYMNCSHFTDYTVSVFAVKCNQNGFIKTDDFLTVPAFSLSCSEGSI